MAPLMSRLYKVLQLPVQAALCPLCRDGETESVEHFILQCPVLDSERREFLRLLRLAMQPLGGPGSHVLQHLQAHPAALLDAVLGKQPPVPTSDGPGQGSKLHENTCAQVLWAWDKLVKNLILVMWRKRKALVGSYTVSNGRLIHTPADDASVQWLRRYDSSERQGEFAMSVHSQPFREFWKPWLRYLDHKPPRQHRTTTRKNFFRVWEGHRTGVFYKWSDC